LTAEATGGGRWSGATGEEGPKLDLKSMRQYFIPCPVPELADLIDDNMDDLRESIMRGIEGSISPDMARKMHGGEGRLDRFLENLSGALRSGDLKHFLDYQVEQVEGFARDGISLAEVESLTDCIREGMMQTLMRAAATPDQMVSFSLGSRILEKFVDATSALTARHYILAREQELTQKESQLERLAQRLLAAQEEERQRIGQDIHDEFIQLLFGLRYRMDTLQGKLDRGDDVAGEIAFIKQRIDHGLMELRRILRNLRPAVLDDLGLVEALRNLVRRMNADHPIEFSLVTSGAEGELAGEAKINLYRIVQEALNNVVKHSDASEAVVRLSRGGGGIDLVISDNGGGFDESPDDGRVHLGMVNMRERAEQIGGTFECSACERGVTISVHLHGGGDAA